jgi:hypothetical protein
MFCKGWVSLKEPWKNVGGYFTKSIALKEPPKKMQMILYFAKLRFLERTLEKLMTILKLITYRVFYKEP